MLSRVYVSAIVVLSFVVGCTDNSPFICALVVNVAQDDCAPVPGVVLTLRDGDYSEEMTCPDPELEPLTFIGAVDRPSAYTLTIEAEGFVTKTVAMAICVDSDGQCYQLSGDIFDSSCDVWGVRTITLAPDE
jgi:hypothetical protein